MEEANIKLLYEAVVAAFVIELCIRLQTVGKYLIMSTLLSFLFEGAYLYSVHV